MKLDKLIKENINKYVNSIINEDNEFNYTEESSPIGEFMNHVDEIDVSVDGAQTELETENYFFQIDYSVYSDEYDESYEESYGETTHETKGTWYFDEFNVVCYDENENRIDISSEEMDSMREAVENSVELDYGDNGMPTSDDLYDDYMSDRFDMDREDY